MELKRVGIAGTGIAVPEKIVTNREFENMVDTSDEWIVQRTGIKERRVTGESEATSDLATLAAQRALLDAGLEATDVGLIVLGTITPDYQLPATACLVQKNIGAVHAGAFDVVAACTGFVAALNIAASFVRTGQVRHALAIGAESMTKFVDYTDRTSCILFGDGAGACVVSDRFDRCEILSAELYADGNGWQYMWQPAGGSRNPATVESVQERGHYFRVHGREVYKFAVSRMVELVQRAREVHSDIEFGMVVPHQVNMRIIESAREKLSLREEDIAVNIHKYGNTSAASVPIMLHEAKSSGQFDSMRDKLIILCAFGAGLTWGYAALKW